MVLFYSFEYLEKFLEKVFILNRKNPLKEIQYSYAEVVTEAKNFRNLLQEHGIGDRHGIAMCFKDYTPTLLATLLGILNQNCFFCPVADCGTSEECIAEEIQRLGACFLLSDGMLSNEDYFSALFQCNIFNETLFFYKYNPVEPGDCLTFPKSICYSIGTSGSTGKSRVVYVPYSCIAPNVNELSDLLGITRRDVLMLYAPLSFDPFVIEFFLALRNGSALILTTRKICLSSENLIRTIMPTNSELRGVTILQMTPSLFRLFVASSIKNDIPSIFSGKSSLRVLLLGGEKFPSLKEWRTWLPKGLYPPGKRVFNIYGITEVSCWSTIHERTEEEKCTPLGNPIDNGTILRLIDSKGDEVIGKGRGELQIGSATRKCYLTRDEATRDDDGNVVLFRCTGDLVERSSTLELFYTGRLTNTVKRFGKLICLDQISTNIENLLGDLAASAQCDCIFDDKNKELVAFITLPVRDFIQEQKCRLLIIEKLKNHEKPDIINFIDHVPLTSHGKKCFWKLLIRHAKEKKTPVEKFCSFLEKTLGIKCSINFNEPAGISKKKRLKNDLSLSFIAAGGTSFHALSLATDIAMDLVDLADQKQFLNLVLNETNTIKNVIDFLGTVQVKIHPHTKVALPSTPLIKTTISLNFLWRANTNKCVDASPNAIECDGNSYICVGSHSHALLTLNGLNGEKVAMVTLPDRIEGTVEFISNTLALVGCYDGHLYAFDFLKGIIHWDYNFGGMIKSKPVQFEDTIIVANYSKDFNLSSISLKNLQIKWQQRIGLKGILVTPIILKNSNLIVCTLDGTFACINAVDGALIWIKKLKSPIFSKAVTAFNESQVVIAEVHGTFHIFNTADGETVTSFDAGGNIFSGISVQEINKNNIFIFFGCYDHNFYCMKYIKNENSITLRWKYCLATPIYSTARIFQNNLDNGFICTCSTKGLVVVFDIKTGELVADYDLKADVFSSPCIGNNKDKIYIGCRDNFVYCLSFNNGAKTRNSWHTGPS